MSEIKWLDVPGYEAYYEVSSAGEVRSKPRDIKDKDGKVIRSLGSSLVQIHKTSTHPKPYVILHDGTRYNNVTLESIMSSVSF